MSVYVCVEEACVCVSVCMFRWPLTLQCPDTPDEYLQDTGGEKRGARSVRHLGKLLLYTYINVCVTVCVCVSIKGGGQGDSQHYPGR